MKTGSTIVITFSPTHASKRVAKAVAQGADCNGGCGMREIDLTHTEKCDCRLPADAFAVISAPVYGGHIPPTALERMSGIRADGTPAAIIVTYGNRAHEEALPQLYEFVTAAGFRVIAEGAFIGEHSYCTDEYHIAAGRPDADDLTQIDAFAKNAADKIMRKDFTEPEVPGHRPYRDAPAAGVAPLVSSACIKCGLCAENCPAAAIPLNAPNTTDASKCFMCMRCARLCPAKARALPEPVLNHVEELLKNTVKGRTKNEIYL